MKKLFLAACVTAFSSPALAEHNVPSNYSYIGLHVSQHYFDLGGHIAPADFDEGLMPGVQFGMRFKDQWSIQGWWGQGDMDFEAGGGDAEFTHYFVSARHHYKDTQWLGFEPYSGATVGQLQIDGNEETLGGFELGLQRGLNKNFIIDLGVRPAYSFDNERWDGEVYAAVNFAIGGGKQSDNSATEMAEDKATEVADQAKAAITAAVDSDGDGVVDALDKCTDTSAGSKVDEAGCNVVLTENIRETLYVQFSTGGSSVAEASVEEIGRVAQRMREFPDVQLLLEGHTDSSGGADLNRRLSQQRADAVKQVLVERFNIDGNRIDAVGRGEDAPAFSNDTADGRAKNRRVEAVLQAQRTVTQ
ncbi:MAG: OmpA family protein [Alcanivoracaceae bacterium]|nr:OmpA family protein [Alcanivoracaceae bacterium]